MCESKYLGQPYFLEDACENKFDSIILLILFI